MAILLSQSIIAYFLRQMIKICSVKHSTTTAVPLLGNGATSPAVKAMDVMIDLLRAVQAVGISAKYVLLNSWFSSPKSFLTIKKELQLDTIAMIR